jgi:hypothetical protein
MLTLITTTEEGRRVYFFTIRINGSYMTDELIYALAQSLDQRSFIPKNRKGN